MSNEREDLARRAVACKGWRWMPGMKVHSHTLDIRVFAVLSIPYLHVASTDSRGGFVYTMSLDRPKADLPIPDLDDPATLGCLLALVREARDEPYVYLEPADSDTPGWLVMVGWLPETATMCFDGPTEAEALVAALEAAP